MILRIFEAFAGFGGASFGLKKAGIDHVVVGYSEIDKFASQLYELNHPGVNNYGDITLLKPDKLPDFDIFTGGFPCQPFSNAGLGLGENDERGQLVWDIVRICQKKRPKYILLENVKGFASKRHKPTLERLVDKLEKLGYTTTYAILNSADFGNAQTRQRFWFLAVLKPKLNLKDFFNKLPVLDRKNHIVKFLDKNPSSELYLTQDQCKHLIYKHSVDLNVSTSLCLDIYNKKIKYDGSCITLTEPHHNGLRIVEPMINSEYRVRKLSIGEMFRLMGLSKNDINTKGFSYFQLAKRAANGWDVMVVKILFEQLFKDTKSNA
jgi:DNA (cytosine-5)-methyltransferase 1